MNKQNTPYQIKVCGMRNMNNIKSLITLNPDFIGYIFYPKSTRYVGENPNANIFSIVPNSIKKAGVFVKEDLKVVVEKSKQFDLDYVQLHGGEDVEYCRKVKLAGAKVIKAFSVDEDFNFNSITDFEGVVDYFLFDTKTKLYGGSGKKFNWKLLDYYNGKTTVFLSGGIGQEDAEEIKKMNFPFVKVLDLNSKFETEPGIKNIELLVNFIDSISSSPSREVDVD